MVEYATLFALLSMAAIVHCSWINGGNPPPVSTADYNDLIIQGKHEVAPEFCGDFIVQGKQEVAHESSSDFIVQGKHEVIPGPDGTFLIRGKHEVILGPDGTFVIQGKRSDLDAPNAGTGELDAPDTSAGNLIIQKKELAPADGPTSFIVQGKVYCDPCRIQFPTKISYPLPNTKIFLLCRKEESDEETYRLEGVSDEKGKYTFIAVGDHADEVCEITVSESPNPKCPELIDDESHVRVSLTNKHGAKGNARIANPLGFMEVDADPRCKEVLDELGFTGI